MFRKRKQTPPSDSPYLPHVVINQQDGAITVDGEKINFFNYVTGTKIKITEFGSLSEVKITLTFHANVTVIPPDKYDWSTSIRLLLMWLLPQQ